MVAHNISLRFAAKTENRLKEKLENKNRVMQGTKSREVSPVCKKMEKISKN